MSSTFLYVAIVAVWAVVLVPMWLRRDTDTVGFSRLLTRRAGTTLDERLGELPIEPGLVHGVAPDFVHDVDVDVDADVDADADADLDPPYAQLLDDEIDLEESRVAGHRRHGGRAAVIARRRRRTFGLTLLVIGVSVVAAIGLAPWWVTLPPVGLLTGHLALLRVAVGMDVARQRAMRIERARIRAARERAEAEARAREEAARAQIIDFAERARARDVFDQYAADGRRREGDRPAGGDRRAVGD